MNRKFFSDKENGPQNPRTEEITLTVYNGIISVYSSYKEAMAVNFPDIDYYNNLIGLDVGAFKNRMLSVIPDFTLTSYGHIGALEEGDEYDSIALLDFIEFCWENINDYKWGRYSLIFNDGNNNKVKFKEDINKIFERNGIVFRLNDSGEIERILPIQLDNLIKSYCHTGSDEKLNKLIDEAINNIIKPRIEERQIAIEKLWDAFERIKTYYLSDEKDKKDSIHELIENVSEGSEDFYKLINEEMNKLTWIGNNFRIRHHETNKIDIVSKKHLDFLFYRMMSMISLLVLYIN